MKISKKAAAFFLPILLFAQTVRANFPPLSLPLKEPAKIEEPVKIEEPLKIEMGVIFDFLKREICRLDFTTKDWGNLDGACVPVEDSSEPYRNTFEVAKKYYQNQIVQQKKQPVEEEKITTFLNIKEGWLSVAFVNAKNQNWKLCSVLVHQGNFVGNMICKKMTDPFPK